MKWNEMKRITKIRTSFRVSSFFTPTSSSVCPSSKVSSAKINLIFLCFSLCFVLFCFNFIYVFFWFQPLLNFWHTLNVFHKHFNIANRCRRNNKQRQNLHTIWHLHIDCHVSILKRTKWTNNKQILIQIQIIRHQMAKMAKMMTRRAKTAKTAMTRRHILHQI